MVADRKKSRKLSSGLERNDCRLFVFSFQSLDMIGDAALGAGLGGMSAKKIVQFV